MSRKTFYVTTPIYYPSSQLHIGHVYSTTIAWVLRNYKRMQGYETKFLTGSDEHGQKIANTAHSQNITPQQLVDEMAKKFQKLWSDLEIDFDYFSRTSSPNHVKTVQYIFSKLLKSKNIYLDYYEGLYSIADEEFLTKTQAKIENGQYFHPISHHALINVKEDSYFLDLQKYQSWLEKYWEDNPQFIIPQKVANELRNNFLNHGLENLSITRTSFDWGIPVLENEKHIVYVWLDALSNYISALGYSTNHHHDFDQFWSHGDEIIHVVGKEISRFHAIYWPIILKSLNLKMPTAILAHGWLITPQGKMSKSKGNVINPYDLLAKYEPEVIKYYFSSQIHFGHDGVFSFELLKNVYNADLANNFGNLLSRAATLSEKNFSQGLNSYVPSEWDQHPNGQSILEIVSQSLQKYINYFDKYEIDQALKVAIDLSKLLNLYIEAKAPWNLTTDLQAMNNILHNLFNGLYAIATFLQVVMPKKMIEVKNQLGLDSLSLDLVSNFEKFSKIKIFKKPPLFTRI